MTRKIKRAFYALMIVFMLMGGSSCATTAGVGFGYHVPVTSRIGTGIYFGFGF